MTYPDQGSLHAPPGPFPALSRGYIPIYTGCMTFLNQICNALQTNRVRYALVGGYAVALHGAVRGTVDVDALKRIR